MKDNSIILFWVTKNYDAMKQFFRDLGWDVPEADRGWQITPAFNQERGCAIMSGSLTLCLEESTDVPPSGPLYMEIGDIGVARLLSMKSKYAITDLGRGFSDSSSFRVEPPDGGAVVFTATT